MELLEQAPTLRARDARILDLNECLVWVDSERLVYDTKTFLWFPRDVLVNGSAYGTQVIDVSAEGSKKAGKAEREQAVADASPGAACQRGGVPAANANDRRGHGRPHGDQPVGAGRADRGRCESLFKAH